MKNESKVRELNFEGMPLFCGIDVHKKNWRVNIRTAAVELEDYSQDASAEGLLRHLNKNYPGAGYQLAYEAGFSGFGIQRFFDQQKIACIIVNPADVPSSDKDRKRKQDKIDARKLSRELSQKGLSGIYVPSVEMEQARALVRQRTRLVRDQTRCKNRIWHLLMFSGLEVKMTHPQQYWSRAFVEKIKHLGGEGTPLGTTLDIAIEEYLQIRKLLNDITRAVRAVSSQEKFSGIEAILQSIPGIGLINAMVIHTEIGDMKRFKIFDRLCSYAGVVPDTGSSGDTEIVRGITHRSNHYLRVAIIESSWTLIRKDPAMLIKYRQYSSKMPVNKAIIKIAKHLLSRIRYLWLNGVKYKTGMVA